MPTMERLTYGARADLCTNPAAGELLRIMDSKKTNLALAADVTSPAHLLELADNLGPFICLLKTHIDILDDFFPELITHLIHLSQKHGFLIFEDRKFADIGNTVVHQYRDGIYQIASWAHITNAHVVPGPGIIQGLKQVGLPLGRGLLLLAEMSSAGSLATGTYTESAVKMATTHSDFVIGFICQRKLVTNPTFVHMTPGVSMAKTGDQLGQKYHTPHDVIGVNESDVMIVGRAIIEAKNPFQEAQRYREAGWQAYLGRQ